MDGLVRQLKQWQGREWVYRAAWGVARWTAVVLAGLVIACFLDWWIDCYRDTPFVVRFLLTTIQLVIAGAAAYWFVYRLDVPSLVALAGRAEESHREFDHRLVTALQLNRDGADTRGMSPQLIHLVTNEAEAMSSRHTLAALAESWRLKNAAMLLLPLLIAAGLYAMWKGPLVSALVSRQALLDVPIPRSVFLENETASLIPSGDEVTVRYRVTGKFNPDATGSIRVTPEGQPTDDYPLRFETAHDDGSATYVAVVPPSSVAFRHRAWLQDGRTREYGQVTFEARPVVRDLSAGIILPEYVGLSPSGKRYGRMMAQGEIVALTDSTIRIGVIASKVLSEAVVVVLARNEAGQLIDAARHPMTLESIGDQGTIGATVEFRLPPQPVGYRVEVKDRNGFTNSAPPYRGITLAPDDPPRVLLLPEVLKDPKDPGPLDDYDVTGMPLVIGGQVQIAYAARSPLGVARAQIRYRVNDGDWNTLPLALTVADPEKLGRFIPELGVFENSGPYGQVEFYPVPAGDPESEPNGLDVGGRYNFQTAALTKTGPDGQPKKLDVGDRVEFFVEAFDRKPAEGRAPGRSESRMKSVVTPAMLDDWNRQRVQTAERLRQIEERQKGIFVPRRP